MLTPRQQGFSYYQRKANRAAAYSRGSITFAESPTEILNDATVTLGGTVVAFISGTPSGNQIKIAATDYLTLQNLLAFLNNSTDAGISQKALGGVFYAISSQTPLQIDIWGNTLASLGMTVAASVATAVSSSTSFAALNRQRVPL